jgi:hypothetical protein
MNKVTIYRYSLILSIVASTAGATLKILHYPYSGILLPLGLVLSLIYICIGLYDSFLDKKEPNIIKLMWLVGFVVLSWIVGILYLPKLKKNQQKLDN